MPVSVFRFHDELDILGALIEGNRQRAKTNEQIGRESVVIMRIEKERAKLRQADQARANQPQAKKGQNRQPSATSENKERGRARDAAGKKTGVSGWVAEQSAFCVTIMDALDKLGKKTEAHMIRQVLNKNVSRAYRLFGHYRTARGIRRPLSCWHG